MTATAESIADLIVDACKVVSFDQSANIFAEARQQIETLPSELVDERDNLRSVLHAAVGTKIASFVEATRGSL